MPTVPATQEFRGYGISPIRSPKAHRRHEFGTLEKRWVPFVTTLMAAARKIEYRWPLLM